jgi:OPA family glycerol-3-phosphate transporter-like MFS transporter
MKPPTAAPPGQSDQGSGSGLAALPPLSPAFLARRSSLFLSIGFMYSSYYMCRYNWNVANKAIGDAFHFSNRELGWVGTASFWSYALGQLVNGPIIDRVGGKRAILIGAAGTILFNLLLAFGTNFHVLAYFIAVWGLNGYFQAFGASSLVKVNSNWLRRQERGIFTGIFGFMIQLGRWATTALGGWLLVRYPWPAAFIVPPAVTLIIAVLTWIVVADNPEDLGFPPVEPGAEKAHHASPLDALRLVLSTRPLWFIAGAYFCTGVVRHGLDQWYAKYLQEVHHIPTDSWTFQLTSFGIPVAAVCGSFFAGFLSDRVFGSRRAPAAAVMYFGQLAILLVFIRVSGPVLSGVLLMAAQFFVNGPHSLLGGAAAMDFGGRKSAGSAAGMIDFFQYVGAGLTGFGLGHILDTVGWSGWAGSLTGFALLAALLMCAIWKVTPARAH